MAEFLEKGNVNEREEKESLINTSTSKTCHDENVEEKITDLEDSKHVSRWNLVKFGAYYFFTGGAPAVLVWYLPVYYRQLGLGPQQIGLLQSIQPWISIPIIPLWGYIADRLNATRKILLLSLVAYLVSNASLALTPTVVELDCEVVLPRVCQDSDGNITSRENNSSGFEILNVNGTNQHCVLNTEHTSYLYDDSDLLWLYIYFIIINAVGTILHAPCSALSNAAILNCLEKEFRNRYGYFKASWAIASALGVLLSGLIVDNTEEVYTHCGIELKHVNYNACFIGFAICMVFVIIIACTLSIPEQKKQDADSNKDFHIHTVFEALWSVRYGSAFLAVTWLSIAVGVAKSFDFWYIEAQGGSHSVMALTGMLGTLVQVFAFFVLPSLNDRFGHLPFLTFALVVTGAGCAITAFITNPWGMLIPLCFRGLARAITSQSAGAYLANSVDKNHMATLQSIVAATTTGVGNGVGSLLGGILINKWSPFVCYFTFAIVSFVFACLLLGLCCYDKIRSNNMNVSKSPEELELKKQDK